MKLDGITSTALLALLVGIVAPAYALHEQQGEKQDHPDKSQAAQHEQARPEQQHAQQQQQNQNDQQQHAQQRQQQNRTSSNSMSSSNSSRTGTSSNNMPSSNRARPSNIPRNNIASSRPPGSSIGRETGSQNIALGNSVAAIVATESLTAAFEGTLVQAMSSELRACPSWSLADYPRFQSGGYWISLVDRWPGYWTNNWYDTDDVYVNYVDNGYCLFNRRHPTVGVAISISM